MSRKFLRVNENNLKTYQEFYNEFQIYNKVKNLSQGTIQFYEGHLKHLEAFLVKSGIQYINDINEKVFYQFILYLQSTTTNSITVNTHLRAARAFVYYAISQNYIDEFKIKMVKAEKKVKPIYSDDDIKKLIKKPNLKKCSFSEYRDWVMVQYLLETGNRLNSVINIKINDLDLDSGYITLRVQKNKKQQINPIGNSMTKILFEYIKTWGLKNDEYLFPTVQGKQMNKDSIQGTIKYYNQKRKVKLASIHAFRHYVELNIMGSNLIKSLICVI